MFVISGLKLSGVVAASVASAGLHFDCCSCEAQITQGGITVAAPEKGTTQNLSVTNGSRTALAVGNTTSFGAASNLTLSKGLTGVSRTVLIPSSVAITSDIGDNALGETTINISNLAANGDSGSLTPDGDSGVSSGSIELTEELNTLPVMRTFLGWVLRSSLTLIPAMHQLLEKPVSLRPVPNINGLMPASPLMTRLAPM